MQIRQMVEIVAMLSAHSPQLIEFGQEFPRDALQRYWSCCRGLQRLWTTRLDSFPREMAAAIHPAVRQAIWLRTLPVLEEILLMEITSRVWTAIAAASDRHRNVVDAEPITRNVLLGHLEARRRVLHILVHGPFVTVEQATKLDRLRNRAERWTDLLMGYVVYRFGIREYCFDAQRALDFGEEQLRAADKPDWPSIWHLYLTGLRTAFPQAGDVQGVHPQLRLEIVNSLLAAFPAELWRDEGSLLSRELFRFIQQQDGNVANPKELWSSTSSTPAAAAPQLPFLGPAKPLSSKATSPIPTSAAPSPFKQPGLQFSKHSRLKDSLN